MARPQRLRAMRETWLTVFSDSGWRDDDGRWHAASPFTATEHHVALTLATYMSPNGDSCFPSIPRLAIGSGRADSTVREALDRLVEFGFLERRRKRGRGNSNEYVAQIPAYFDWDVDAEENRRRAAVFASGHEQLVVGPAVKPVPDAPAEAHEKTAGERRFSVGEPAAENRRSGSVKPPDTGKKTAGERRQLDQGPSHDLPRTEEISKTEISSVPPEGGESERAGRLYEIELALSAAIAGRKRKKLTRSEFGAWRDVANQLVEVDATADDVTAICAMYRERWPGMVLTPHGLAAHWTTLGAIVASRVPDVESFEQLVETDAGSSPFLLGDAGLHRWMEQHGSKVPDEDDCRSMLEESKWALSGDRLEQAIEFRRGLIASRAAAAAHVQAAVELADQAVRRIA